MTELEARQLLEEAYRCIRDLRGQLQKRAPAERATDAIAIVGMGCRFPGADDLNAYWSLLRDGRCTIGPVPADRWDVDALYRPTVAPGKMNTRWGGYLDGVDQFDAEFFGLLPREAIAMDPQQRLLLEVAYEALDHAGLPAGSLAGSDTGVFVGVATSDFGERIAAAGPEVDAYWSTGNARSIAANRLSNVFDLHGPSIALDTACSSSLTAVHLACRSLLAGECGTALAAGVNLMFSPAISISFSQAGATSPSGRCRPFDAQADGMVRGEGAGVLVLKRLSKALADGDTIHAVIRGSAVNQDGRTLGIAAPNPAAQRAVLEQAWRAAGVDAAQIRYIEMHGTGTPLGDPLEARAVGLALGGAARTEPCRIGSVKGNFGHTEAAAGIAGLIKTALAIRAGELPASLHFERPNPHADLARLGLQVQAATGRWPGDDGPRIAGVSSFGFGGANAHVVLASPPAPRPVPPAEATARALLLPLSARKASALRSVAAAYARTLADDRYDAWPALRDLCHSAAQRRDHHAARVALVVRSRDDALAQLRALAEDGVPSNAPDAPRSVEPVCLVYSGHRSTIELDDYAFLLAEPPCRAVFETCDAVARELAGWSPMALIESGSERRIGGERIALAHPLIFMFQAAVTALWRDWGLPIAAVAGHSVGEIAAAEAAGCLDLADAMTIVVERSRLLEAASRQDGSGGMLAVECPVEAAQACLADAPGLALAAHNGPTSVVIAGDREALGRLRDALTARRVYCRMLDAPGPGHTAALAARAAELGRRIAHIAARPPGVPFLSGVNGLALAEAPGAAYWQRQLCSPVRYAAAVAEGIRQGLRVFDEVAPYPPTLVPMTAQCGRAASVDLAVLPALRRGLTQREHLLRSVAALYAAGHLPAWQRIEPGGRHDPGAPSYPWQRTRLWPAQWKAMWATGGERTNPSAADDGAHPLLGRCVQRIDGDAEGGADAVRIWERPIDATLPAFLGDHRIEDVPVMPAAAYFDLALAAARACLSSDAAVLEDVRLPALLSLQADAARCLQTVAWFDGTRGGRFKVLSRPAGDADGPVTTHATGRYTLREPASAAALNSPTTEDLAVLSGDAFYARAAGAGAGYHGLFRGVRRVRHGGGSALADLAAPFPDADGLRRHVLHPALLDLCFQTVLATLPSDAARAYLPIGARRVECLRPVAPDAALQAHVRRGPDPDPEGRTLQATVELADARDGRPYWRVVGLQVRSQPLRAATADSGIYYRMAWQPAASLPENAAVADGTITMIFDDGRLGAPLAARLRAAGLRACTVVPHDGPQSFERGDDRYAIDPRNADHYRALIDAAGPGQRALRLVHLWSIGTEAQPDPDRGVVSLLLLTQAVIAAGREPVTRLHAVTQDAHAVRPGDPVRGHAAAALHGWARTLAFEHPALFHRTIDLQHGPLPGDRALDFLAAELRIDDGERHVAERGGLRLTARLVREAAPARGASRPVAAIDARGWQLITGGLGGLGLLTAGWLVGRGCKRIALVGRHPPDAAARAAIDDLRARGAEVLVAQLDVAERRPLQALLETLRRTAPVTGIVHAAGTLRDGLIVNLDPAAFAAVAAPKTGGAHLLHALTEGDPVSLFVCYSSVATLFGSPGQANYAAANAGLDALAAHRHAAGLPALSINWGPWSQVGGLARAGAATRAALAGFDPIDPALGMAALDALIAGDAPQVGVARVRWPEVFRLYPNIGADRYFSLLGEARDAGESAPRRRAALLALAPAERRATILRYLRDQVAAAVGMAAAEIDPGRPLTELGLDSLMALETKNRIEAQLGIDLPVVTFLEGCSLEQLAGRIAERLHAYDTEAPAAPTQAPAVATIIDALAAAPADVDAQVDALGEDDLDALLGTLLARDAEPPADPHASAGAGNA
ncbi:MAG: SDR family NAD(P)-dependent oxidoreductase [Proteobacteria bacterium]|nr:SDR family NAD(P)-dependent oxidoreductase [Pseudomonadota bacterium]